MSDDETGPRWLVLIYRFPRGPGSRRVKIWRRLQNIGAVAIKKSAYVLPRNDQAREDFEWLLGELTDDGAEGAILESRFVGGLDDPQVSELFNAARNADYRQLIDEMDAAIDAPAPQREIDEYLQQARRALARGRKRMAEIQAIDFFGAELHAEAGARIQALDELISGQSAAREEEGTMPNDRPRDLVDRIWVTRRNVRVDRMASAWLIRRWIDPEAEFKFVTGKAYRPSGREIRFDMFEAEFTHAGDLCTFEVLNRLLGDRDRALSCIAEIVHDIDLKDGKFGRPETAGIAALLAGIAANVSDDADRLERSRVMFDDLHRYFGER